MNKIISDIEIARAANIKPINEVLKKSNISDDPFNFSPMGRHIAKLFSRVCTTLGLTASLSSTVIGP